MSKHIHIHLPKGVSLGRKTKDAGFDESKHKRDEGGKFTAGQHHAKAAEHEAAAKKHRQDHLASGQGVEAYPHLAAAMAHEDAANNHKVAAEYADEQTSSSERRSQKAMNASAAAHKLSAGLSAPDTALLQKVASDKNSSAAQRAAAAAALSTTTGGAKPAPKAARPSR